MMILLLAYNFTQILIATKSHIDIKPKWDLPLLKSNELIPNMTMYL